MSNRDVYIAIMRAAALGKGLRLTAREVFELTIDDAITRRAWNGLTEEESQRCGAHKCSWADIDPDRTGKTPFDAWAG